MPKLIKKIFNHVSLGLIIAILTLSITAYTVKVMLDQPIHELQANLSQTVSELRIKLVNIKQGCEGNGALSTLVTSENIDRIRLTDKLISLGNSVDVGKILGKQAKIQLICFIQYNLKLTQRKNICDSELKDQKILRQWEQEIDYNIYNKSNSLSKCKYYNYENNLI